MTTAALLSAQPPEQPRPADAVPSAGIEPGSPEWHAIRRSGIGGSDVAGVLNVSRWTTPLQVYLSKLDEMPPQEDNPAMLWGRLLEPLVRQRYADTTGQLVTVPRQTFRSERHPFMIANLDGMVRMEPYGRSYLPRAARLLEVKTARSAEGWGEPGSSDIPLPYLLQVMHYMVVMQVDVTDVAVLIGGNDFRVYEVPADRELQELIVESEAAFWQRVQEREPPPVTTLDDARLRWGRAAIKGTVPADAEALEMLAVLRDATQQRKDLEGVEAECKALLMTKLADRGDTLVDIKGRPLVTWKLAAAPKHFDTKAFASEQPVLYAAYSKEGEASRRFLVKADPAAATKEP